MKDDAGLQYNVFLKSPLALASLVYFFLTYYTYLFFNPIGMLITLLYGIAYIIYFGAYKKLNNNSLDGNIYIVLIICMTLMLPFSVFKAPVNLFHYASSVVGITVALHLFNYVRITAFAIKATLYITQFILILYVLLSSEEFPLETITQGSSNGVTSYLIVLQAVHVFYSIKYLNRAPFYSALITLYLCYVGYGRGSLISAAIITSYCMFFLFFNFNGYLKKIIIGGIFSFVIFYFVYIYIDSIYYYFIVKTKLSAGLIDSSRLSMYSDYFTNLDAYGAIFGGSYSGTAIELLYGGNPHSSIVRAHYIFGLPFLIVIFFIFTWAFFKTKFKILYFSTVGVIFFRSMSEPFLLPSQMDFFLFLILFSCLEGNIKFCGCQN